MKILITESLDEAGLSLLRDLAQVDIKKNLSDQELCAIIGEYEALVVRSRTEVTEAVISAGCRLRVIARAGTGVDNIDVDAATRRGILVVNAPSGNNNAVAEHTVGLILALARRLFPAVSSLKAGRWEKSALEGVEVKDKALGLVGLGRIGSMVASKARGLEMRVGAFDPYMSPEHAASRGVELMSLNELLEWADFISVHTPLTPQTHGLIGLEELARLKPTAYIINCARGGIIDEEALKQVLQEGLIAGAALDVFEVEPAVGNDLVNLPNVIATPHLGASTVEAQESVARDVAQGVIDALEGRVPSSPVNVPYLAPKAAEYLRPYIDLAQRLGSFFVQWQGKLMNRVELAYEGSLVDHDTRVLTAAFLAGMLQPASSEPVNIVNALPLAEERGLVISEVRRGRRAHFDSLITASFPEIVDSEIAGTVIQGEPHLVRLDGQQLDCIAQGRMLVDLHVDRPGIVGSVGQLLGQADINISFVQMSRVSGGGSQIMILGLDQQIPSDLMERFLQVPNVQRVQAVNLPAFDGMARDQE